MSGKFGLRVRRTDSAKNLIGREVSCLAHHALASKVLRYDASRSPHPLMLASGCINSDKDGRPDRQISSSGSDRCTSDLGLLRFKGSETTMERHAEGEKFGIELFDQTSSCI